MSPYVRALLAIGCLLLGCHPEAEQPEESGGSAFLEYLGGQETAGFERVTRPRPFLFPDDHGEHPDHQLEWWYFTGNLEAGGGRRLGFELTFFRFALSSQASERASRWATRQLYLAHFAITDIDAASFHATETRSRGALGLAGVQVNPWRVWNGSWSASSIGPDSLFPMKLEANDRGYRLDLTLDATKPIVLQGVDGYSRKGSEPGNASYYYSFPRIAVTGEVVTPARAHEVTGWAWMDHEWSTSVLGTGIAGWDWFAIHFDDGTELMVYHLRGEEGGIGEWSRGTFVDRDGRPTSLDRGDFDLRAVTTWKSESTGAEYPSSWTLKVPSLGLDLSLESAVADQELRLSTVYWEGAIFVRGSKSGRGYAELVGYAR